MSYHTHRHNCTLSWIQCQVEYRFNIDQFLIWRLVHWTMRFVLWVIQILELLYACFFYSPQLTYFCFIYIAHFYLQVVKGVLTCVTQEVKDLFHLLEHDFLPLDLFSRVQPLLTKISKLGGKLSSASSLPEVQLSCYIPALEKLASLRLLQQVCLFICYLCCHSLLSVSYMWF